MNPELGPGAEFDLIRRIAARLDDTASGLGDDCAFLELGGETLAISTDSSVEGIHFRRDWLTLAEIGWRAAAAALSDLAAVGAGQPRILAAITTPEREDALELMAGVGDAVREAGGTIIGGDLSRGPSLSLTITVLGLAPHPVRRSGAQPGDLVWVTGTLGSARAAWLGWERGLIASAPARAAFAKPRPRILAGQWLARHGATAMLDLSDGLAGDARHLAAASGTALMIELERVPCGEAVVDAAGREGIDPAWFAAQGGEDYELLVTLPADFSGSDAFTEATGIPLTRIGRCAAPTDGGARVDLTLLGQPVTLSGYDHFR